MSKGTTPVQVRRDQLHSDDIQLDDPKIDLGSTARGDTPLIEPVHRLDKPLDQLAREEDFMQQKVEVHFHDPVDESENPYCEANVNGIPFQAVRGEDSSMVPRFVLEVIARSRITRIRTERRVLPDGSETMVPRATYSQVYPFTVIHDPAGAKGVAWLRDVMSKQAS